MSSVAIRCKPAIACASTSVASTPDTGFGRTGEFRLGYEGGWENATAEIGNIPTLPTTSGATGDIRIQYQLTTLDDPVLPRGRHHLLVYTKGYNTNPAAPSAFPLSEIQAEQFFRLSAPTSIFVTGFRRQRYGYKTGFPAFSLGGSRRLVAWSTNELLHESILRRTNRIYPGVYSLPPFLGSSVDGYRNFRDG